MEEKIYIFKVSLGKKIYRTIEIYGAFSLFAFAEAIVSAYNFSFDHAFGFYDNFKNTYDSKEAYTLFCDEGQPVNANEKSVKESHVHEVFEPAKKMGFLFDYGDDWNFLVECLGVTEPKAGKKYPVVTEVKGKAPPQYPDPDSDYD